MNECIKVAVSPPGLILLGDYVCYRLSKYIKYQWFLYARSCMANGRHAPSNCMWYCMMRYCTVNQTKCVLASCMLFGLYIFLFVVFISDGVHVHMASDLKHILVPPNVRHSWWRCWYSENLSSTWIARAGIWYLKSNQQSRWQFGPCK